MVKTILKALGIKNKEKHFDNKGFNNNEAVVLSQEADSLKWSEWNKLFKTHVPFSKYLPYIAYDTENQLYYLRDNYVGFLIKCVPVLFTSEDVIKTFTNLFSLNYPFGSVIQIQLIASPWFKEQYLIPYLESKTCVDEVFREFYKRYVEYYLSTLWKGFPPNRNFFVLLGIKFPEKACDLNFVQDLKKGVYEMLRSCYLHPTYVEPEELLLYLRRLFGQNLSPYVESSWCRWTELSRQIISCETEITVNYKERYLKTGDFYWKVITPRSFPPEVGWDFIANVTGSYSGPSGDLRQVTTPFILTLNVVIDDAKKEVMAKANIYLYQQSAGSFIVNLRKKQEEYLWATKELSEGQRFLRAFFSIAVFGVNLEEVAESAKQVVQLWNLQGCQMQEERDIIVPTFMFNLPFGFYYDKKSVTLFQRDFILPVKSLSYLLPIQADYLGTGEPALLFKGRKGQVISLDIFSQRASNYNFFIAAPSGKGKSFLMNYIVFNYLGMGVKVRIVDVGRSYKKLCKILGGDFIEFTPENEIGLNPFAYIGDSEEDISLVVQILVYMITSSTEKLDFASKLPESAVNLLSAATKWALRTGKAEGRVPTIDDIYYYLSTFPEHFEDRDLLCEDHNKECHVEFRTIATHLAFNLQKYISSGIYGRWFSNSNVLHIGDSPFVVLELEELKTKPDLFRVISLLVLNAATSNLYLSDRKNRVMVILDEAWQFLQGNETYQKIIEEGYRRARKYFGSFSVITQSILDLETFGPVGKVIYSNSAFRFFLESGDFYKVMQMGILPFDSEDKFMLNLLNSIKFNAPKYTEIFLLTDNLGYGVLRLAVDKWLYYLFTTNPREVVAIEELLSKGLTIKEAIEVLVKEEEKWKQK